MERLQRRPFPYTTYGSVVSQGQDRGIGWANRDVQKVAFICSYNPNPSTYPGLAVYDYEGTQLAQYLVDHADDQPRMIVAMSRSGSTVLWNSTAGAAYQIAHPGAWREMYNYIPGNHAGVSALGVGRIFLGGMLFAAMRGNADAKNFIASYLAWVDHIANHSIQAGDSWGQRLCHWYRVAATQSSHAWRGRAGIDHGSAIMYDDTQYVGNQVTWDDGHSRAGSQMWAAAMRLR